MFGLRPGASAAEAVAHPSPNTANPKPTANRRNLAMLVSHS